MTELSGATVLITGATSGIGLAAARLLAPQAGTLMMHGLEPSGRRNDSLLRQVRSRLGSHADLEYLSADYSELAAVDLPADAIAARVDRLDVIINNAALPGPPTWTTTTDGNEITLQVDYLAPVALSFSLIDRLGAGAIGRIVNVASATHLSATLDLDDLDLRHGYTSVDAYARAKLALVAHTCRLARRLPTPGIEAVSMHPGVIATDLLHAMFSIGGDSPEHAAQAIVAIAGRHGDSGTYYDVTKRAQPNPVALDHAFQDRLHELTLDRLTKAGITLDTGVAR